MAWNGAIFVAWGVGIVSAFAQGTLVKLASLGAFAFLATPVQQWMPAAIFFTVLLASVGHVWYLDFRLRPSRYR